MMDARLGWVVIMDQVLSSYDGFLILFYFFVGAGWGLERGVNTTLVLLMLYLSSIVELDFGHVV